MKSVKVFAVAFVAVAAIVATFAFTTSKRAFQDFRFDPSLNKRLIQTGQPLSISVTELGTASKYSTGLPAVTYVSAGAYLRAINFDVDAVADGGSNGKLTLQEAVTAVANYYNTNGFLPADGAFITVGTAQVVIRRSNDNTL